MKCLNYGNASGGFQRKWCPCVFVETSSCRATVLEAGSNAKPCPRASCLFEVYVVKRCMDSTIPCVLWRDIFNIFFVEKYFPER